ncbi:cell division protein ZapA [Novosphingobium sp. 9]|uniref:cell division protein ZapA n=1 Tax=Novosphingobium sp. 9 TaxID=2025349 RepID=UPI0021B5DA4A|nr:cell division protein ZapA [Novosphingobium sp. 9]
MTNITVTIAARKYSLACDPEDQPHVEMLAGMIDERLAMLGVKGQTEARSMLYAALFLADELCKAKAANAESAPGQVSESVEPDAVDPSAFAFSPEMEAEFEKRLGGIATRIENLADLLEHDTQNA